MSDQGHTSTALAMNESAPLPIQNIADFNTLGTAIAQSGMFGSCTPGKGAAIAVMSYQERMSLLEIKRSFHITNQGDISMRSDRMLAEFQRRGGKCKWIRYDAECAEAEWSFRENENIKISFTIKEAKDAGFIKSGSAWKTDPGAMLRARVISRAIRMLCPGAVCGTYTPEELEDLYGHAAPVAMPNDEPASIDPVEAAKRVEAVVEEATPFKQPASGPVNYAVCPVPGKLFGTPWESMDMKTLGMAKNLTHETMEPEHFKAVQAAIEKKQG